MSIDQHQLVEYLVRQINTFIPDGKVVAVGDVIPHLDGIMDRTKFCFSKINNKYFFDGKDIFFNHLHSDQYAMFLYFACNTLYKNGADIRLCIKICQLNKYLHGIDAFYEVELPDIFLFVHPLGTVLGRGKYADYFLIYQRCGIGSNHDVYPVMKEYVTLRPGSSILGNCLVKENCTIAAGSLLLDKNLEKNSIYIGNPRDYIIKTNSDLLPIWKC
jgi:serine O-acetyltransferase